MASEVDILGEAFFNQLNNDWRAREQKILEERQNDSDYAVAKATQDIKVLEELQSHPGWQLLREHIANAAAAERKLAEKDDLQSHASIRHYARAGALSDLVSLPQDMVQAQKLVVQQAQQLTAKY